MHSIRLPSRKQRVQVRAGFRVGGAGSPKGLGQHKFQWAGEMYDAIGKNQSKKKLTYSNSLRKHKWEEYLILSTSEFLDEI